MITKREDIELLFKDLSARLLYGVKGLVLRGEVDTILVLVNVENPWLKTSSGYLCTLGQFKPYLRPMSSMTYEEKKEFEATKKVYSLYDGNSISEYTDKSLDWLLSHHFDFRNLIGKGLALEAPEGMYK